MAFTAFATTAAAENENTYYADASASGEECTQAEPCPTIGQALAKVRNKTGGAVFVAPGEYRELVRIGKHGGGPGQYLNIIGIKDANGNRPLITPPGGHYEISKKSDWLVWLLGSYIKFSGFEVAYSTASKGINMGGSLQHDNVVEDNKVHHIGGSGIWCEGNVIHAVPTMDTNCLMKNNEVYFTVGSYCQYNTDDANPACIAELLPDSQHTTDGKTGKVPADWYPKGYWGPSLTCGNTRHCHAIGNKVHGNFGEGIAITANIEGEISGNIIYDNNRPQLYISNTTYNKVFSNLVYVSTEHQYYQSKRYYDGEPPSIGLADDWLCFCGLPKADDANWPDALSGPEGLNGHDNLIYNNLVYGGYIALYDWFSIKNVGLKNTRVFNNTFVNAPLSIAESGEVKDIKINHFNSVISNNIFINGPKKPRLDKRVDVIQGVSFKNNLWQETPEEYALYKELADSNDIVANSGLDIKPPAPGSLSAENFKLPADSPAKGKGLPQPELNSDFQGTKRNTEHPTIGAIE